MNTPNKLTVLRLALVPVFVALLYWASIPYHFLLALLVFAAASVTDALDGYIARKKNLSTTFGKFLDPIADKVLVVSALLCFIRAGLCSAVAALLIIAREFIVTSVRLAALSGGGKVVAASLWGKIKTAFTMVAILLILLMQQLAESGALSGGFATTASLALTWAAAALTVVSGAEIIYKNRQFINTTK